jgi:hypothetical protein
MSCCSSAAVLAGFYFLTGLASGKETGAFTRDIRPLLESYCFDCHSHEKAKGEVNLERFLDASDFWRDPKLWEKVLVQLQDRVMPPVLKDQPSEKDRERLARWIHETLENPDRSALPKDPGWAPIHRLTRLQYNNTLRDLLGMDQKPADQFPPDGGGGGGFENNAATLFVPPLLMEKYVQAAAESIAATAPEQIFLKRPTSTLSESTAARHNLAQFASRGFRRPVLDEELAALMRLYEEARQRGELWEDAVRLGCEAVLVAPQFLFRVEADPPGQSGPYALSGYELATRLSYFIWASMPDAELIALAGAGRLTDPAQLEAQVMRMLADSKSRAFSEDFASQWLRTRELRTWVAPAPEKFPQFTADLREAFYREPVEFFSGLIRGNGTLIDLLHSDYTYANETLARFYGIDGVRGPDFQRVLLQNPNRGGILGMGGVLTLTSYARRTSPVLRGKWVMEEILGSSPPPPPPFVNTQKVSSEKNKDGLTFRQRLELHRQDPRCAGCHARMDPLGFGLENFDPIGAWRDRNANAAVDASGQLVSGEKFTGPAELKQLLLQRKDTFVRTLTEKLLAYALGRGLEPADWITVREICAAVAADNYRIQRLIVEVTRSYPFLYRRPSMSQPLAQTPP